MWRRIHEPPTDADFHLGAEDGLGRLPEPCCGWVFGALLDGEIDVGYCGGRGSVFGREGVVWRGGDCEAAGFWYAGDVEVNPLAGAELAGRVRIVAIECSLRKALI